MKLICGASNQDLASIGDLCALFSVAGVHCVDVAADAAVVRAARDGLDWAWERTGRRRWIASCGRRWLGLGASCA